VLVLGYVAAALMLWMVLLVLRRPAPELPAAPAPPSLEQLQAEVDLSPSYANRVRIGWALLHAQQPARAQAYFEQALATHTADKQALYGLGISQLEQQRADVAVKTLSRLVERSFAYEDYDAALALVDAHVRAEQEPQAAELLAQVASESRRLEHAVALARHHARFARRTEAQEVLRAALQLFDDQPAARRQREGAAATEARRLLRTLDR
jgi:hypothetical protein